MTNMNAQPTEQSIVVSQNPYGHYIGLVRDTTGGNPVLRVYEGANCFEGDYNLFKGGFENLERLNFIQGAFFPGHLSGNDLTDLQKLVALDGNSFDKSLPKAKDLLAALKSKQLVGEKVA